ncbi:hypothetical protein [Clostridium botulinum]|uniref:hypothetical protein n=1 Tax=Clostridium botulinum TaxID=1491 RepID=UPI000772FFD2|nr:hypothetical protein [Clostridium botulinum]AUN02135.1 hypothetical protein RSJ19_04080 [Clostridium botulinum]MBN3398001.1 hypothetical protein [Clostridium botulinum]MBN3412122.1 hypothetical protein [Clostridium botulinum]
MAKFKYSTKIKDKLVLAEERARNEVSNGRITKNLGVNKGVFYKYKKQVYRIFYILERGKEIMMIDFGIKDSLLKRTLEYKYKEVTKELV